MKKLFAAALIALTSLAFGATTTPVQLLNPTGSTAGQAIVSNGPSTPPTWGTVALSGISGTLAIANGGTGATSANAALTNLGAAPIASPTFTGTPAAPTASAATNSTQIATTGYVVAKLASPTPIGSSAPSTGAFTTLSASGTVSGAGFTNLFASPPVVGLTTPNVGVFTALVHTQQERDTGYTVTIPTTGQTVTLASGTQTALITPAGALASLTITLPACNTAYDGSIARYVSFQNITSLTVNATSGTVVNPPTSATIAAGHGFLCRSAATAWYPLY